MGISPTPQLPRPDEASGASDGRGILTADELHKQRSRWGKEWGSVNSQIGKQLRKERE